MAAPSDSGYVPDGVETIDLRTPSPPAEEPGYAPGCLSDVHRSSIDHIVDRGNHMHRAISSSLTTVDPILWAPSTFDLVHDLYDDIMDIIREIRELAQSEPCNAFRQYCLAVMNLWREESNHLGRLLDMYNMRPRMQFEEMAMDLEYVPSHHTRSGRQY